MYIITGLGNPGKRYENTRHNLGFIAVDRLAEEWDVTIDKAKFQGLMGETKVEIPEEGPTKVLLLKPQTFMNLSGKSVREAVQYYKVPLDHLLVIYDDLDLPVGRIRVRPSGSAGTHRGMQSIVESLGSGEFPRIRIGIGNPEEQDVIDYVVGRFTKEETAPLANAVQRATKACFTILTQGVEKAMNQFNGTGDEWE